MRSFVVSLLILACFSILASCDESRARVIVHKEVKPQTELGAFVENANVTVNILVRNIGGSPASNVIVNDDVYEDEMIVVEGELKHEYEELEADAEETFTVVLKPTVSGSYEIPACKLVYDIAKGNSMSGSSMSGKIEIVPWELYLKIVDKHLTEWGRYLLAVLIICGIPAMIYAMIRVQYVDGISKSRHRAMRIKSVPKKKKN